MTNRRTFLSSAGLLTGASLIPVRAAAQTVAAPQPIAASDSFADAVDLHDFEVIARQRISRMAYEYIAGGAADEITLRWNREAWDKITLWPRTLVDAAKPDTKSTLLGHDLAFPILLAPTAYHRAFHPEGEVATARGAGAAGAIYVVSTSTTTPIATIAGAASHPIWFQLYVQPDRGFVKNLIQEVEAAGVRALCITVDQAAGGARNRQTRAKFQLPAGVTTPYLGRTTNLQGKITGNSFPVTVRDLDWLRSFVKVPIILKGILHPDDANEAVRAGAAGIVVSNHGARVLDTVPATIDALPRVLDQVSGRVPVLLDGGIRRGTDVLKALATGASAVLIGRPYLYGLGAGGAEGVTRVVNILRHEFEMAMALTGRSTLKSLDRSVFWPGKA